MKKLRKFGIAAMAAVMLFIGCNPTTDEKETSTETETPTTPETPTEPEEDDKPTFTTGNYSYTLKGNNLTINYTGNDTQNLELSFCIYDSSKNDDWKYNWLFNKYMTFNKSISVNLFEHIWAYLYQHNGYVPDTFDITIFPKSNGNDILEGINVKLTKDQSIIDAKDYSKKSFTPKSMGFNEESSKTAVEKMKMAINMTNHFDCCDRKESWHAGLNLPDGTDAPPLIWETCWDMKEELTLEHIKYLKSIGVQAIRLVTTWYPHMDSDGNIMTGWMNRIQEVVDWCMDENIYVILNSHHDSGAMDCDWLFANDESYNKYNARYKKMWEQIADRFKNYSEKLIFASANEVCTGINGWQATGNSLEVMKKWNQDFLDTVRKSGGHNAKRNLVVAGVGGQCDSSNLQSSVIPSDRWNNNSNDHLIFEVHYYNPMNFTHNENPDFVFDVNSFDPKNDLRIAYDFSKANDIPVIMGEWGILYTNKDEYKAEYAKKFVPELMKYGIASFNFWSQGSFGYTSINDANSPSPLFLKAIQDAVKNTTWREYCAAETKSFTPNISSKNFTGTINQNTGAPDYHTIDFDITDLFDSLPKAGDTVNFSFKLKMDKDIDSAWFWLVDTSSEADYYRELLNNADKVYINNVKANEQNDVNASVVIKQSAAGSVKLRIEYAASSLDDSAYVEIN